MYRDSSQVILDRVFAAFGDEVGFCGWVDRLGGQATAAAPTTRGGWSGAALIYLRARLLLDSPRSAAFRETVEAARRDGAIVALVLDDAAWMQERGGPRIAYELAAVRPDILFATEASAAQLGVPLEGIASVPVVVSESGSCSVHGRHVPAAGTEPNRDALAAAFCVAFVEGEAPVEAAGHAVLVAAR